jgi:hypothetical protein
LLASTMRLIDALEQRLKQRTETQRLFAIRWILV